MKSCINGNVKTVNIFFFYLGYPLTILGGIVGKNHAPDFDAPCRAKNIPREIPPTPWYRTWPIHCVVGGFLPFSAISVELYYVFATLWSREPYTLYGILGLTFIIALCVTATVSIALTYFQLAIEDHEWWWRSIFAAGSSAVFVFIYATFYFFRRSSMTGFLQTVEFFSSILITCYAFFLALGTVAFFASLIFVRYIYRTIKMDWLTFIFLCYVFLYYLQLNKHVIYGCITYLLFSFKMENKVITFYQRLLN